MTSQLEEQTIQYTHCPLSQEVKVIRQWNLVSEWNKHKKYFSSKNNAKNEAGRLVSDLFHVKASGMRLNFNILR